MLSPWVGDEVGTTWRWNLKKLKSKDSKRMDLDNRRKEGLDYSRDHDVTTLMNPITGYSIY